MVSNGLPDISELRETTEVECKLAHGARGKGALPKDFWPTYSAFANTHGGVVFLGIREGKKGFSIDGILEPDQIEKDLFNCLNNPQKVSANVIVPNDVTRHQVQDGRFVISIKIAAANRKQKPVFLKGNPFQGNTYRRLHEGDRPCNDETVKRMLAEQIEDERDNKILKGFSFSDINVESFIIYRQMLRDVKPTHPWLELDDETLLERLRGIRVDRETGQRGLTIAGLLMFGRSESIQDALPYYFVDYQERPKAKTEARWIDRLVPDGTWSGNIFDFYRRVYRKLTADIKVPFEIDDGRRKDDSLVHEAIREALVNTPVHADYTGRISVLVVKRPDMFGFRNPGQMRVSLEQAERGGESDCRNRILHQMFLMIGAGERAGSGIPKIYSGWQSQSWRPPALYEKDEPEQTLLELRMFDLLPQAVVTRLRGRFGEEFNGLTNLDRLILATAATEGFVTHSRLQEITTEHTRDLTLALQRLIRKKFLESSGKGRSTVYTLPGVTSITPEDVFAPIPPDILSDSEHWRSSSEHLKPNSEHSRSSSEHLADRDRDGCLVSAHLDFPIIDNLEALNQSLIQDLRERATEPRQKKRLSREIMRGVILKVSAERYLTLNTLAAIVNRDPDALRQQHLNEMVKQGVMKLAFPATPKHPMQAYKSNFS